MSFPIDREKLPYRPSLWAYVVDTDGKFLIYKNVNWNPGEFGISGGGIEEGEDPEDTIRRELLEEFSMEDIEIVAESPFVYQFDWPDSEVSRKYKNNDPLWRGQTKRQFLVRFLGDPGTIKSDPGEIDEYRWVQESDLPKYLLFDGQMEMVRKVLADWREKGLFG